MPPKIIARTINKPRLSDIDREVKRRAYLEGLDSPPQAIKAGGTNDLATISGVPGRPEREGQGLQLWAKGVIYAEPIAVVMRDAVTPETAERLLGIERRALARSIRAGYVPAIKLGTGTVPFLVRLRDVVQWVRNTERSTRARPGNRVKGQRDENTGFIGFQPWLVEHLRHHYPETVLAHEEGHATPYAERVRPVSRGGRPQKMVPADENPADEKTATPDADHAPGVAAPSPAVGGESSPARQAELSAEQRYRLPKWHRLWLRRPGEEAQARTRLRR